MMSKIKIDPEAIPEELHYSNVSSVCFSSVTCSLLNLSLIHAVIPHHSIVYPSSNRLSIELENITRYIYYTWKVCYATFISNFQTADFIYKGPVKREEGEKERVVYRSSDCL